MLHPRRIRAAYAPGVFEATRLVVAAASVVVACGLVAGGGVLLACAPHLAPWVELAALLPLGIALKQALGVGRSLWAPAACRILVRRGWVEIGRREVRRLEDARVHIEHARLGLFAAFTRVTLAFPDGQRVPLVQGPSDEVLRFERQLRALMEPAPSSCR